MSLSAAEPNASTFFVTPLVIEPSSEKGTPVAARADGQGQGDFRLEAACPDGQADGEVDQGGLGRQGALAVYAGSQASVIEYRPCLSSHCPRERRSRRGWVGEASARRERAGPIRYPCASILQAETLIALSCFLIDG
jgi:hypothetical protein